jgi:hypothetical protein
LELDTSVRGFVKLGGDTTVKIEGRGTILFICKNGEYLTLPEVYFIPKLCNNIVSLGQLDEIGFDTHIRHGQLLLGDSDGRLLARVPRSRGRLYILHLKLARPVCLAMHGGEDAWRWHARYGHMHFDAFDASPVVIWCTGCPCLMKSSAAATPASLASTRELRSHVKPTIERTSSWGSYTLICAVPSIHPCREANDTSSS